MKMTIMAMANMADLGLGNGVRGALDARGADGKGAAR
jgi:hypothetical protein